MATYIHQTPGRIRIQLSQLKSNDHLAQTLQYHLERLPGMNRVFANTVTGSLKLHYEESTIMGWEILSVLRKAGLLGNLVPFPRTYLPNQFQIRSISKLRISPRTKGFLFQLATLAVSAILERGVTKLAGAALKKAL